MQTYKEMPELFKCCGFSFFFYSREHEPLHVHVEGASGALKYSWDGSKFILTQRHGVKANELKKIYKIMEERKYVIVESWYKFFEFKQ